MEKSCNIEQTKKLAGKIARNLYPGDVIALYGDLGSGKTTFTRLLSSKLGFVDRVQSPTFVIARVYDKSSNNKIKRINHVDLYRIKDSKELADLGLTEMFSDELSVTIIEWPEIAEGLFPKDVKRLYFDYVDEKTRSIKGNF